jgi:hypothetical protein
MVARREGAHRRRFGENHPAVGAVARVVWKEHRSAKRLFLDAGTTAARADAGVAFHDDLASVGRAINGARVLGRVSCIGSPIGGR